MECWKNSPSSKFALPMEVNKLLNHFFISYSHRFLIWGTWLYSIPLTSISTVITLCWLSLTDIYCKLTVFCQTHLFLPLLQIPTVPHCTVHLLTLTVSDIPIWQKSDLYLRYSIWLCSSELYMNFVFAYCIVILTSRIGYFKRSKFEDNESCFVITFSCHLGYMYVVYSGQRSKLPKYLQSHKSQDLIGQYN